MKIKELILKKYNYDTTYQREVAWAYKNWNALIDSIINDFFIPPILLNDNEVVDGKQRIIAIQKYMDDQFPWKNLLKADSPKIKYSELNEQDRVAFDNYEIKVIDLKINDQDKLTENFLRININSIKLNKIELSMAKAPELIRDKLREITQLTELGELSNFKYKDKRFSKIDLLVWILSMIYEGRFNTKGIRKIQNTILNQEFLIEEFENGLDDKLIKTLKTMYAIFGNDTFSANSFKTVFCTVFVGFYNNLESFKSFTSNKKQIKKEILELQSKLTEDQMGGGIKFDSWDFIQKRVHRVEDILEKYSIDKKRVFSYDEKLKLWNNCSRVCGFCNKEIKDINDAQPDHIFPHSRGGKTNETNLQLLHAWCNSKKSDKIISE